MPWARLVSFIIQGVTVPLSGLTKWGSSKQLKYCLLNVSWPHDSWLPKEQGFIFILRYQTELVCHDYQRAENTYVYAAQAARCFELQLPCDKGYTVQIKPFIGFYRSWTSWSPSFSQNNLMDECSINSRLSFNLKVGESPRALAECRNISLLNQVMK